MGKKQKVIAQKMKNAPDPSLAHSHKKGAIVELVQPSNDKRWGRYYFIHYRRWFLWLTKSLEEYEETIKLLSQCRKIKIDEVRGTRHVEDDLRDKLELHSTQFLVFLKLGFEYMTLEMLPAVNQIQVAKNGIKKIDWDGVELNDRVIQLVSSLGITSPIPPCLFDFFVRRDIVEHPNPERLYNATEDGWKNNHLAWVLGGEIEGKNDEITNFVNVIAQTFDDYVRNNPIQGKLEGVQRGLKSVDPFKK